MLQSVRKEHIIIALSSLEGSDVHQNNSLLLSNGIEILRNIYATSSYRTFEELEDFLRG